jgi:hypothetical protein
MKKTRIAILIALALGMPLGVVAVERAASELPPASEPPAAQAEAPAPAEAPAQPADIAVQPAPVPAPQSVVAAPEPVAMPEPVARYVESDTFPQGSLGESDYWQSPVAVAYFERQDQERRHLVARGDAFPSGHLGDNAYERMPTELAYYERIEQQRLARLEAEQQRVAAAAASATPAEPVQAAESSAAGSSAPANEPAPAPEREQVVAAESRNPLERAAELISRPFRDGSEDKPAVPAADTRVPMAVDSRVPMTAGEGTGSAEGPLPER